MYSPVPWDYSTFGVAKKDVGRCEYVGRERKGGGGCVNFVNTLIIL
jgi:hypothetical protein